MLKKMSLLALTLGLSTAAGAQEAFKYQVTCSGKGAITDLWTFKTNANVFTDEGFNHVKVDPSSDRELLATHVKIDGRADLELLVARTKLGHRQLQLHLLNGTREMLVSVSSAEDAKKVWESAPIVEAGANAVMTPERLVAEYNKNATGKAKNLFLVLHRDAGSEGFSYAGFCKLRSR